MTRDELTVWVHEMAAMNNSPEIVRKIVEWAQVNETQKKDPHVPPHPKEDWKEKP